MTSKKASNVAKKLEPEPASEVLKLRRRVEELEERLANARGLADELVEHTPQKPTQSFTTMSIWLMAAALEGPDEAEEA